MKKVTRVSDSVLEKRLKLSLYKKVTAVELISLNSSQLINPSVCLGGIVEKALVLFLVRK